MAFDPTVKTRSYAGNEDRRWLGTRLGADQCRSVMLDASAFLAAHLADKGAVPSGTVLGQITATGLYAPYTNAAVDGTEVARGFLFNTTILGDGTGLDLATAANVGVPLYWGPGIIKTAYLPAFAGTVLGELDANAQTDLAHFIRFETGA